MTTEKQIKLERWYLDHFLRHAGISAENIVRGGRSPSEFPDFKMVVNQKKIAVELTEFHQSREEKPADNRI